MTLAETCSQLEELLGDYDDGRVSFRDFTDLPSLYLHTLLALGDCLSHADPRPDQVDRFLALKARALEVTGG